MKRKSILIINLLIISAALFSQQRVAITLTFTAVNLDTRVQLDSVRIINRIEGDEYMIYWPDTSLTIDMVAGERLLCVGYAKVLPLGINEGGRNIGFFSLSQNYPNPVCDHAIVPVDLPHEGNLAIMITDVMGRIVFNGNWKLERGRHFFGISPGRGNIFLLTAAFGGQRESIRIIASGESRNDHFKMKYNGAINNKPSLKAMVIDSGLAVESGIIENPHFDTAYRFQFAYNVPCPGTPIVDYEGKEYHTVQIFSQCWLKENLDVGGMIQGDTDPSDNGIIEKYCYDNEPDSCAKYGGLYQWYEMMEYSGAQGSQGICPAGWHVPTDEEWKVLEGASDSQYGIGDSIWENNGDWHGFDAGTNLKAQEGWNDNGNGDDLYGFAGKAGGFRYFFNYFDLVGGSGYWWSSTLENPTYGFMHSFGAGHDDIFRNSLEYINGFSVRCVKDD